MASEYLSQAEQNQLLDLSDDESIFDPAADHKPEFVSIHHVPEFAEFLLQRLQLAVAKDVTIGLEIRSCLKDIDEHDILDKLDIEVSYEAIGLLLADQGHPPTIAQLKQIPSILDVADDELRSWFTVYIGILEKKGQKPHIYIGSCSSLLKGSLGRIKEYQKLVMLFSLDDELDPNDAEMMKARARVAQHFDELLQDGYEVTSMHQLFRIPLEQDPPELDNFTFGAAPIEGQAKPNNDMYDTAPKEGQANPKDDIINLPQLLKTYLQCVIKCLEAFGTIVLWAFWRGKSRNAIDHKTEHYLREVCPFDIDMFEYHGLCSHSPLSKGISGYGRTAADLEEAKRRRMESKKKLGPMMRLNIDGTLHWRTRLADLFYWGRLMEDGYLHNATKAQKREGEAGLRRLRGVRKTYMKHRGAVYVERPIAESPIPPPKAA
ncbi:hypothetical protein LTS07_001947 [Exophiala sideris]|uniref:Uncharacterized protein n=1 Tax=Exophiala sideris TaxID=1016849 RepID=A0ABR0JKT3_9EURO|nr:hypothetical protein LTR13_007441 [Exophiala sideris]KAK5036222.1 hypothetical protein LTS07_001947 [Exophiala sideris]KAK5066605.1 hypothetical protein LTR69_001951 [Exophiala sideris]KAK5180427.1 hypothetical protein LTR44_007184 [Eurotiomycetes sp. CCFEE 6388]